MVIHKVRVLDVFAYRDEFGYIHSGDIVFEMEYSGNKIELIGFTGDAELIMKAMKSRGSHLSLDIRIGVYRKIEKVSERVKGIKLRKKITQSGIAPQKILDLQGEIAKITKKVFPEYKTTEYHAVIDCGFRVDFVLDEINLRVGDYVVVRDVSRFDVSLPESLEIKCIEEEVEGVPD